MLGKVRHPARRDPRALAGCPASDSGLNVLRRAALVSRDLRVPRREWNHREARCPRCSLHLDPLLDLQS